MEWLSPCLSSLHNVSFLIIIFVCIVFHLGIDFSIAKFKLNGLEMRFQLWDTAGQEKYRAITTSYYRRAMGVVLVYDVTKEKSFLNLHKFWIETAKEVNYLYIERFNQINVMKIPIIYYFVTDNHVGTCPTGYYMRIQSVRAIF